LIQQNLWLLIIENIVNFQHRSVTRYAG